MGFTMQKCVFLKDIALISVCIGLGQFVEVKSRPQPNRFMFFLCCKCFILRLLLMFTLCKKRLFLEIMYLLGLTKMAKMYLQNANVN